MATEKSPRGRKLGADDYKPIYCKRFFRMARAGLTDEETCAEYELSGSVFRAWKRSHPEFAAAIKKGRMRALMPIVGAMHRRATGYDHAYDERRTTTTTVRLPGPLVEGKKTWIDQTNVVVVVTGKIQHVPADVTAGIFVLKNRARKHWYDQSPRPYNVENPNGTEGEAAQKIRDAIYAIRDLEGYAAPPAEPDPDPTLADAAPLVAQLMSP